MNALLAKIEAGNMSGVFHADVLRTVKALPVLALGDDFEAAETQMHRATYLISEATGLHAETVLDLALAMAGIDPS